MKRKLKVTLLGAFLALGGFTAHAADVTVKAMKSDGSPFSGVAVAYIASSTSTFGTTGADGKATKSFADGTYRLKLTVNGTSFVSAPMALSGTIQVDFATTAVTVSGNSSMGTALAAMSISYANSSVYSFGTTDVSGVTTKELFPGTYNFRASYKGSTAAKDVTVGGDGMSLGSSSAVNFATSKVNFIATAGSAGTPVQSVGVSYVASGSNIALGSTDATGTCTNEVFPGTYVFKGIFKGTSGTVSGTISGDGTSLGSSSNVYSQLSRMTLTNSGSISYLASSSWQSFSSADNYLYSGAYTFKFRGAYTKVIDVNALDFDKSVAILILKDNTNAPLSMDGARGGVGANYSTWHVSDTTTANGIGVMIDVSNKSTNNTRSYEVRKNGSTAVVSQDLMTNNVFNFKTSLLTLNLKNCAGTGLSGGSVRYGMGSSYSTWFFPGGATDASGKTSMQSFPATFSFEMSLNSTTQVKSSVVFTGTESYTWNTTNLKLNYPGDIAYGGTGDSRYFNKPSMELLPGSYKFNFRTSGTVSSSNYSVITIPDGSCTAIEKTPVIVRLVNSSNTPLEEGAVTYYLGGWSTACYTKANGNIAVLLNGNQTSITSAVVYNGSREQKNSVTIPSNAIVTYQTGAVTMDLMDADGGHSIEGTNLQYYAGAWRTFGTGTTSGGTASIQLLPGTYSFAMSLNGTKKQIEQNIGTTPTVQYNAGRVTVHVTDNLGGSLPGATVSYYGGAWNTIGTTDVDGNATPVNYLIGSTVNAFRASKGSKSLQVNYIAVTSAAQTVTIGLDIAPSTSRTTKEDEVLVDAASNSASVKLYPNPASNNINITIPSSNGTVEIYSLDGRQIAQQSIENGKAVLDISSYANGVYNVVLKYDGKSSAHKLSKL